MSEPLPPSESPKPAKRVSKTVTPGLRVALWAVFALTALLGVNSIYLLAIRGLEWVKQATYQNYFFQWMFLAHLVLGILLVLPFVVFGIGHALKGKDRPNRRAVRVGWALLTTGIIVLVSGVALMRIEGFFLKNPLFRSTAYWAHVIAPVVAVWLYVLHRLVGPKINWRIGIGWGLASAFLVMGMVAMHSTDPRKWNVAGSKEGAKYFEPSLARTSNGKFIPAESMMNNEYCLKCHEDSYNSWFHSAHRFSSFNNPAYLFSVRETRKVSYERDGNVKAARWCAGCHDPAPFFSGAFDDPKFDDVNHPTSQAGITCTTCHAITHVNSTRGNADFVIEEPVQYPFAFSTNRALQFINNQLIKGNPEFHKKTFLKPLHKTAEFCSTCHKVSIPQQLTKYKEFLRGQNHYDTYLLSGVSGVNARSFYYPPMAQQNCNGCHMPLQTAKNDFGAQYFNPTNKVLSVHDHLFPAANTAIGHFNKWPETIKRHQDFLKDSVRVDIFGLKEGGTIDGKLLAPLRPNVPALQPGQRYLAETVVRTVKLGHPFSQGTVDSNEIWVDAAIRDADGRMVGRSGGMGAYNEVDPWAHFINVYMLDRDGKRIDRRNPQDIFTPLYNNQIPPGAAAVVHYGFRVPPDARGPLTVEVKLQYRKFDSIYMRHVFGPTFTNDLPITTISTDKIVFPVATMTPAAIAAMTNAPSAIPPWMRWNDYGIGLFNRGDKGSEKGELIQAAAAFAEVEKLGKTDGPLNLARVFNKEGRLDEAVTALQRAADTNRFNPPGNWWTISWLNGLVNKQNGFLDQAIKEFTAILENRSADMIEKGFDFARDYEVINELGQTLVERSKMERGDKAARDTFLKEAERRFLRTVELDSENLTAHYNLGLIYTQLGDTAKAAFHQKEHEKLRPDDNARDRAVAIARRNNPAADHAAQAVVIYDLQRPGAHELPPTTATAAK